VVARCKYLSITQSNYLDIGNLLVNELVGSVTLTILLGLIWIAFIGAKYRFPAVVTVVIGFVWAGFVLTIAFNNLLWILYTLLLATLIYLLYAKVFKK